MGYGVEIKSVAEVLLNRSGAEPPGADAKYISHCVSICPCLWGPCIAAVVCSSTCFFFLYESGPITDQDIDDLVARERVAVFSSVTRWMNRILMLIVSHHTNTLACCIAQMVVIL